jgi:D-sedoheptulose 7-phosphate isomerase
MSTAKLFGHKLLILEKLLNKSRGLETIFNQAADSFTRCLQDSNTIFWCGNGGSASESSHLAVELIGRFKKNRRSLPSISLNADSAAITCIANDFGYDQIFSRQLEGLGKPGDVLVVLSTSGMSENINKALKQAKLMGVVSIALLGKGGGSAAALADYSIVIDSNETARIQEMHLLIGHTFCEYAEMELGFAQE